MATTVPSVEVDVVALSTVLERLVGVVRQLASTPDISLTAASTLRRLELSGPSRISELAVRERVTQPGMTQLVSRLERDGYVQRHAGAGDARVVLVSLTTAGADLLAHRRQTRANRLGELMGDLSTADRTAIFAALPALNVLAEVGQALDGDGGQSSLAGRVAAVADGRR